jgi:hypothetical protein
MGDSSSPGNDGTMPRVKIRDLARLLVVAAFTAVLITGCSADVPGEPAPSPEAPPATQPRTQPPAPTSAPRPAGGCTVTATSTGSISSSGASSRASTINGRTSYSCGDGPLVAIAAIDGSGVTFNAGGATVTIPPGTTGQVAGYLIAVTRVADGTAEFQVALQ